MGYVVMSANPSSDDRRQEYLEDRKQRIELHNQAAQSFDQTILTLAGGALGLSFTFIRQIIPHAESGTIPFLATSWILLVLALLAILISMLTSQVGMLQPIGMLDEIHSPQPVKNPNWGEKIESKFQSVIGWRPLTQILNIIALLSTILGIVFLIWFGLLNIAA